MRHGSSIRLANARDNIGMIPCRQGICHPCIHPRIHPPHPTASHQRRPVTQPPRPPSRTTYTSFCVCGVSLGTPGERMVALDYEGRDGGDPLIIRGYSAVYLQNMCTGGQGKHRKMKWRHAWRDVRCGWVAVACLVYTLGGMKGRRGEGRTHKPLPRDLRRTSSGGDAACDRLQ